MKKLLNNKYSKIYLYGFILISVIKYTIQILNFDISEVPFEIIRGILLLAFYLSLVKKPSTVLSIDIVFIFISSVALISHKLNYASLLIFLTRCLFLIYTFQITNWSKIKETKFLNIIIMFILFTFLLIMMYFNDINIYNHDILFKLADFISEFLIFSALILIFINFLNEQKNEDKILLIGVTISVFTDILYGSLMYDSQNSSKLLISTISIIHSTLNFIAFYWVIKSDKIRGLNA